MRAILLVNRMDELLIGKILVGRDAEISLEGCGTGQGVVRKINLPSSHPAHSQSEGECFQGSFWHQLSPVTNPGIDGQNVTWRSVGVECFASGAEAGWTRTLVLS